MAFFYLVGVLKVGSSILLIAGIWYPQVVLPAAGTITVLMLGALAMHAKIKDPPIKSLPTLLVLLMTVGVLIVHW